MAIIYSYPTVNPERTDLILGTDVSTSNKATKNFTVQSIIDLVTVATGDLQTVLNLGNVATGRDINLTNNAFRGGNFVTTGGVSISGTTATGFTNVNSTEFTGVLATAAQPNVTSLGTLSALVIGGPISGTGLITNSNLTGAANDNVVSTLAIKTYVDNKVGLYDTLSEILANGNTTGGTDIAVSAGDDITFTNTSKILMGTTAVDNFEIYSDSANSIVIDRSPGALKLQTSLLSVRDEADASQIISGDATAGVELYHANAKKIETLAGGAKVTGAFQATTSGTFASLINTGTYSDSSGDVGTAGQILSSTGSGTNWVTEVPLYNWSLEGTAIPSGTAVTVTDGTNITTTWDATNFDLTIATTGVPDGSGAANQVTYWSDADTLTGAAGFTFAGGATGKVAIAGELEVGGVLTDGTFTGSAGTYTGYVSITSTDFVGALTGNASTATALAASGAIALTGDTTSTGGPYTYTSGGAISIATTIADTTVTGKVLTNLATPTSTAIAASDTILAAMAKLQGQINGLAGSLAFEGTWNASTDTPTLSGTTPANGVFYIVSVAGNTDLDGITDWQVGDWAIYVDNGAGTDAWQKLDQSNEVLGSGAANKIAKWTSTNTLATGLIADDGTTVTVGNSGNFIVEGNTTLGDADTDSTTIKGPAVFEETSRFNVGISLGATTYGTAGQVLTSGGGAASVNTWTTPTTGTVTSVGLTETGDALTITNSPITTSGNINIAGAGSASQYINGELNLVAFPTLDNYQYWVLSDGTNTTNITTTGTATFASGAGIINTEASGTITTAIDYVGTNNAILQAGVATPIAADQLWFSDGSDNTIKRASISDIVDLGNETLAQVLSTGNTTSGTDIAVSANDDITFTDTSKALFGASSDLQIYHDGSNSYINESGTGVLSIQSDGTEVQINKGASEYMARFITDGAVNLYHNNSKTFETTSTGVNIDNPGGTYSRISLKGSGTTYGTVQGDSTNGLLLRSGGSSNQGLAINGYNSTFLGSWGGGVAGTVMKVEGFFPKVEIGDSTNFGNGNLTDLEVWGDVDVKGKLNVGSSGVSSMGGRNFAFVSKALPNSGAWQDMFSIAGVWTPVISELLAQGGVFGSITGNQAMSYNVAQAGGTSGSVANAPVYNKIIDTGPGSAAGFELQFLAFNASNNKHGYKCQARATAGGPTCDISVSFGIPTFGSGSVTFTDLT